MIAEQECGLGFFICHYEHAAVAHDGRFGNRNVNDLYGMFRTCALRQIDEQAVLRQQGVENGYRIVAFFSCRMIIFFDETGHFYCRLTE